MPTSSRILFHLSRLTGAVLTANRVGRGCRAWAVGYRALVDEFKADGTSRRAREGGRGVCVRGVVRLDGPAAENFARDVRFFPLHTKVWPARRPSPPPPGTGLAARSASVASHTALFAQPQRAVRCRTHPAPAPRCSDCALAHAVSTRGVEQPPHPSHRAPRHACPLAPHVRASPHSAPSALALTALSPRCSDCAPPLLTRCRHTRLPVTEPTRSHG